MERTLRKSRQVNKRPAKPQVPLVILATVCKVFTVTLLSLGSRVTWMHQGHRTRKRSHLSPQPHTPWRMSLNSTMPPSPSKAWRPGVLRTRSPSSLITRSSSSASADPPCSRAPALAGVRKGQRVLGQILRRVPSRPKVLKEKAWGRQDSWVQVQVQCYSHRSHLSSLCPLFLLCKVGSYSCGVTRRNPTVFTVCCLCCLCRLSSGRNILTLLHTWILLVHFKEHMLILKVILFWSVTVW